MALASASWDKVDYCYILLLLRFVLEMLLAHENEDKYFQSLYPAPTVRDVGRWIYQYAFLDGTQAGCSVVTGDKCMVNRTFFSVFRRWPHKTQCVDQVAFQKQMASLSEACDPERLFTGARAFLNKTLWKDFGPDACSSLSDHWLTNVLHGDLISGDTMFLRSLFMFL